MQNFPNNIVPTLSLYFIYYTTLIESCQFARAIIDEKACSVTIDVIPKGIEKSD